MVYIREYSLEKACDVSYVRPRSIACCPDCGERMRVHGTCRRKAIISQKIKIFILRVLACKKCRKTHRELPDFLIGYKRYSCDDFCEIIADEESYTCESSTRIRMMKWLKRFLKNTKDLKNESIRKQSEVSELAEKLISTIKMLLTNAESHKRTHSIVSP